MPRDTTLARDAALHRMRRANRWLIAGAVALTGLLTDVAAQAFPGHAIRRTTVASTGRAGHGSRTAARRRRHATHHTHHDALRPPAHPPRSHTTTSAAQSAPAPATAAPAQSAPAPAPAPAPAQSAPAPAPAPAAPAPVISGGS
jgi:hypothetical protein